MRALTWARRRHVGMDDVPDPVLQGPTDAIVRVTSTATCGSDLHLYEVLGAYLSPGDTAAVMAYGDSTDVPRKSRPR